MKKSLDPHPEFHSSTPGTGRGREDRTGHFQQPRDLFIKASSQQPCLPPPPSPPQLTLGFINAVPLRLEGITSQETFQSQISFGGDQREPRVGGVSAGRFIRGGLAGWERCKTALAASLSGSEQPQAGAERSVSQPPLLGPGCWLGALPLGSAGCSAEHGQCGPVAQVTLLVTGSHKGSARGQRPSPGTARASAPRHHRPASPDQALSPGMGAGSPASGSPGGLRCALSLRQENTGR